MGRGNLDSNYRYFKYIVRKYDDDDILIFEKYFTTAKEIHEVLGIHPKSIPLLMADVDKRLSNKYNEYDIEKLNPKIPTEDYPD